MKKQLLSFAMAMALAASTAGARTMTPVMPQKITPVASVTDFSTLLPLSMPADKFDAPQRVRRAPSTNDSSLDYQVYTELYQFLTMQAPQQPVEVGYGFVISPDDAKFYAGTEITKVHFYNGVVTPSTGNQYNDLTSYQIVIYDSPKATTPVYTQNVTTSAVAGALQEFTLDTPYKLEADKTPLIGVKFTISPSNTGSYIPIDYDYHADGYGSYLFGIVKAESWAEYTKYGAFCIGATLEGDMYSNAVDVNVVDPDFCAVANKGCGMELIITNRGAAPLSSLELTYQIGGLPAETVPFTASNPCPTGQAMRLSVSDMIVAAPGLDIPVKVEVTKVNGEENMSYMKTGEGQIHCVPQGWHAERAIVLEEFTGTWCGWCPRGLVMMEAIKDKYPDGKVIPIAVHGGDSSEPMNCASYSSVLNSYSSGFPSAVMNRAMSVSVVGADLTAFNRQRDFMLTQEALLEMTMDAQYTSASAIQVNVTSKFAFNITNTSNRFRYCFVLTEDKVGPYPQTNYFANNAAGPMAGWESKGSRVSTVYDEVARQLTTSTRLIPSAIQGNQVNEGSATVTIPKTVSNKDNLHLVGMVVDTKTGMIEQAVMIDAADIKSSSIDQLDNNAAVAVEGGNGSLTVSGDFSEAVVYTVSGQLAARLSGASTVELPAGIYIVRAGSEVVKVAVK